MKKVFTEEEVYRIIDAIVIMNSGHKCADEDRRLNTQMRARQVIKEGYISDEYFCNKYNGLKDYEKHCENPLTEIRLLVEKLQEKLKTM